MTSAYLSAMAVIAANDTVSEYLFLGAALIMLTLFVSPQIKGVYLRRVSVAIAFILALLTFSALLISPLGGS